MSVTSSDVDVTSAISSDVNLTSLIFSNVGLTTPMWKRLNVNRVFVTTVLARKFHKNFSEFRLKRCGTFFLFFMLKKMLSGTETVARRVSSRACVVEESTNDALNSFDTFYGERKAVGINMG
jgi:hypothetical protein